MISAIVICDKFLNDEVTSLTHYSKISGLLVNTIRDCEIELLGLLNFGVTISGFEEYKKTLNEDFPVEWKPPLHQQNLL